MALKAKIQSDNRDHPVASVGWAEEALQELAVHPDPPTELWFLTSLVDDLLVLSEYGKAQAYLARGQALAIRTGQERSELLLEIRGAALHLHQGRPGEGLRILEGMLPKLEAFRRRNSPDPEMGRALATTYRLEGTALQTLGRHVEAIGAYQKVQRLAESLGDRREQSIALNKMASLYTLLGRLDDAMTSHRQAIPMAEGLGDLALQAAFHLDEADTHRARRDPASQLAALNRALELARRAGHVQFELAGLVNLADVFLQQKDYAAALRQAEAALGLPQVAEDPTMAAICQVNRGIALNRLGRHAEGLAAISRGLQQIQRSQDRAQIAEITKNLSEEYAHARDHRRAYETLLAYNVLTDELKREADQKRFAEASAAFESDKKQIQIEALKREQRIQARLVVLWVALSALAFTGLAVLLLGRRKLKGMNAELTEVNTRNLELIQQLSSALAEVRTLEGLIPICAYCKKIRDDEGFWNQMEAYISSRTEAEFSHGMCPECFAREVAEFHRLDPGKDEGY
jgi:tetratricopeptide (TPR) repeat protein